jgi:hypothetical protein
MTRVRCEKQTKEEMVRLSERGAIAVIEAGCGEGKADDIVAAIA